MKLSTRTYILGILSAFFLVTISSCEKDFKEINQNPFKPTQTEIGPLFNSVIESLTLGWDEQFYLHNEGLYKITQQAALSSTTFDNPSIGSEQVWSKYYSALTDIRDIERRIEAYEGDPEGMNNMKAMLKTALAYKTFRLTDLFGDIPFFDAGKGFEGLDFVRPKFDRQEEIYKFLFEELKWVNDNAKIFDQVTTTGEVYFSINGFDALFNEDMEMWVKFANSLRLRHALRVSEIDPDLAANVIKDILENDLPLIEKGEDIGLWPEQLQWRNEGVHWSFREHRKLRLGTTMWNMLSENEAVDGSGIFDSRARIFFETNNEGEWSPFPQNPNSETEASGGGPYQSARDINYSLKGSANIYSAFNYYLIRDEDDIPELIITASEVNFLLAEAHLRGIGTSPSEDNAKIEYNRGVGNSILFWHSVVNNSDIWVNKPPILPVNGEFVTINHPKVKFSGATDQLEKIYAQRWIDAFRQPWEAYALTRRTQMTPVEGERDIHYRLTYPTSEAENNPENWNEQVGLMGGDTEDIKMWWVK